MLIRAPGAVRVALVVVMVGVLAAACGTRTLSGGTAPAGLVWVKIMQSPWAGGDAGKNARAYALRLLAMLELPARARRMAWPAAPNRMLRPMLPAWLDDVVDAQVLYWVGAPAASVSQFLTAHVPAGTTPGERGQGGSGGRALGDYLNYIPVDVPTGFASAELATAIIPNGRGSLVRADAQVVWHPPRSAAEYLNPRRHRSVTVTVPVLWSTSPAGTVTRTFTSPPVITGLAALLNRLPALVPSAMFARRWREGNTGLCSRPVHATGRRWS